LRKIPSRRGNMPPKVAAAASLGGKLRDGSWLDVYECQNFDEFEDKCAEHDLLGHVFVPRTIEEQATCPKAYAVAIDVIAKSEGKMLVPKSAIYFTYVSAHEVETWRQQNKERHVREVKEQNLQAELKKEWEEARQTRKKAGRARRKELRAGNR